MKRIAVLAILCLIAIGCDVQESKLTLENAINHLNSQGIEIVEVEVNEVHENHALDIILNDVKPNFFYVKDEQLLTIWVFSSHSDLELGLEDFEDKTATAAWFFIVTNLVKLPFHIFVWQTIDFPNLVLALILLPIIFIGTRVGILVIRHIKEETYRKLIFVTTILSAIYLFIA